MKAFKNNQFGFGVIGVIIVVVAVALVGITGWVVYQNNKTQSTHAANDVRPIGDELVTEEPGPTVTYLEVKEWGVKVPLVDNIKDAYYVDGGSAEGLGKPPTTLWLGLRSRAGEKCDPANNNNGQTGAIGALLRFPPDETDQVTGKLLREQYPNGTLIGDYFYAYQSWKRDNPCGSESELQEIDTSFAAAARKIEVSNGEAN